MNSKNGRYFSGQLVEVRSDAEILQTLDSNGTLNSLPFMPEMMNYCGKRFRISRRVVKTCVEVFAGNYDIREFAQNDVVFLEDLRCSGIAHDGCQRICMLFWKTAWLKHVEENQLMGIAKDDARGELRAKLKTLAGPGRYFCQSTELTKATCTVTRSRRLLKCLSDVCSGDVGPVKMFWLILVPILRKMTGRKFEPVPGPMKKTPVERLDLQAGEIVEVKSVEEIAQSLDRNSKNRGLLYDRGLGKFSGRRYLVRSRLEFMIMEYSGEMKRPEATVILENLTCFCNNVLGGCPRQEVIYWREIWLKRVCDNTT
jgi:hypothetical protein